MNKVTYVDNVTVIGASNLNEIQDEIERLDTEKADIDSPTFTGTPTAPTPTEGDVSTKIATTEFVKNGAAQVDGNYPDMTVGGVISSTYTEDNEPYTYRQSPTADIEVDEIVGGSVGWNQRIESRVTSDTSQTLYGITVTSKPNGSIVINGTATAGFWLSSFSSARLPMVHKNNTAGHKLLYLFMSTHNFKDRQIGDTNQGYLVTNDYNAVIVSRSESASTSDGAIQFNVGNGESFNNETVYPIMTDLTLALGSTIADYVYSLETATSGSGVTWLKTHFPKMFNQYNAYDSGSIKSVEGVSAHKMVGKNQFPLPTSAITQNGVTVEATSLGEIWVHGTPTISSGYIAFELPQVSSIVVGQAVQVSINEKTVGVGVTVGSGNGSLNLTLSDTATLKNGIYLSGTMIPYLNVRFDVGTINKKYKVQLEIGVTQTTFEPYKSWSYPLDSSLTLRGIPKLNNGSLYFDGDTYASNGTVTRKYGIVDLGTVAWTRISASGIYLFQCGISGMLTSGQADEVVCSKYAVARKIGAALSDKECCRAVGSTTFYVRDDSYTDATAFKTAMSGVYLVYEKATPTTETATPFLNPQTVGTTEEYVTDSIVPVGHNSKCYDAFRVPKCPSDDGTYTLKVTVSGGFPTYTWEAVE